MKSHKNAESNVKKLGMILVLAAVIVPFIVAFLLNVKVFKFALGDTESWIGFWGNYIGGLFGMIGVVITTYFIISSQKKVNSEQISAQKELFLKQIEAQEKITLQQVSDTDNRARLVLYQQIRHSKYERTQNLLNELVLNTQVFGKNAKQLIQLKHSFLVNNDKPRKEHVVWTKEALDEMIKSYYILNNNIISLVDSVNVEGPVEEVLNQFFRLNEKAEEIKTLADRTGTTIEVIDGKILELNNQLKIAFSDLRKYVTNKKEEIEKELVKELFPS